MPNEREIRRRYAKFLAEVWADEKLRKRLMSRPAAVLRKFGFEVQKGKKVRVIEVDMEKTVYFILPAKPAKVLSDIDIDKEALKHCFTEDVKEGIPFSVYLGAPLLRCYPCFM